MGEGSRIKFWSDIGGNSALQDVFPSLFLFASVKDVSVAEVMVIAGEQIQLNINFSRAAQDWEISSFEEFVSLYTL